MTKYYLVISKINLFPELKEDSILMIEQIMNAILISNSDNIQLGIERILIIENIAKQCSDLDYTVLLNLLIPKLNEYEILVVKDTEVSIYYPRYKNSKKYLKDVGLQKVIDHDFALEKKISYDGLKINFENTFIDWVSSILADQKETSKYNTQDKLLYHFIEPKASVKHLEIREIIESETQHFANKFRKSLNSNENF